ncbi:uncharacterized protein LOC110724447 isoform X3 [Chenopodium quinoa]|uniref:uncharacterized protein LOC110724447 isoform X3 n=1 Tax=Chenopodium quinoa TaxID=63459 RepID=UPI000B790A25|nr:uncharacterized protein LOC110724447 isoform X3 [Chenopodium quinoa]
MPKLQILNSVHHQFHYFSSSLSSVPYLYQSLQKPLKSYSFCVFLVVRRWLREAITTASTHPLNGKMSIIPTSSEQDQQENEIQQPPPRLTYREKRRIDQAELRQKFPDRKRRGPTRGLKYASKRARNPEENITLTFMDELRRVVGEKANEFICDCSNWVEEFCPLNALNWAKMDPDAKKSLYDKILIGGSDATDALSFQCSILYRHWRFRLKEKYYRGKTKAEARDNRPSTIDPIQWDWLVYEYWSSPKQEINETQIVANQVEGSSEHAELQQDPIYVRLYDEKTKKMISLNRHIKKDGSTIWEPNAEKNYEELKRLHETEIAEHGEDTLSVKDAYMKVLKPKSGYVRGLVPGARPPTKVRIQGDDMDRVQLSTQVHTLSASNEELRASNEQLKASNEELKAEFSRMNKEAIERENKLREDMLKMFEEMRRLNCFWFICTVIKFGLLPQRYSMLLQCFCNDVGLPQHNCLWKERNAAVVAVVLPQRCCCCCSAAATLLLLLHCCHNALLLLLHCCHNSAAIVLGAFSTCSSVFTKLDVCISDM